LVKNRSFAGTKEKNFRPQTKYSSGFSGDHKNKLKKFLTNPECLIVSPSRLKKRGGRSEGQKPEKSGRQKIN